MFEERGQEYVRSERVMYHWEPPIHLKEVIMVDTFGYDGWFFEVPKDFEFPNSYSLVLDLA